MNPPTTRGPSDSPHPAPTVRVSLVLVARNARETVLRSIRDAEAALAGVASEYELIVADDAGTDGTADQVRAEAGVNPRIRLVQDPQHRGMGAALRAGLEVASLDLVACTVAGRPFDAPELARLVLLAAEYDVAVGWRVGDRAPLPRRLLSWTCDLLAGLLTEAGPHATGASLTAFRREHLPALRPECDTAFAPAEVLARARLGGLTTAEFAVPGGPCPPAPAGGVRGAAGFLTALLRFWWSRVLFPASEARDTGDGRFWLPLAVLALLAGALLFGRLSYPLLEPDEGRYAEVVREMVASGDWGVPRLNGVPFYDKPLLFYWLVGGSFRLFGVSEAAARLVPALAAFLTVLACFVQGRRIIGTRPAFLAAGVLALTVGFMQCGRVVIFDSLLTLFVTLALLAGYEAVRGERLRRAWWAASAVFCSLGVMTKGPVALVLLAPPLAAHAWLLRSRARPRLRDWAAYVALVLALAVPLFAFQIVRDRHFAYHFFFDQHLVRFFLRQYHVEPGWYYLPVLAVGLLPWSFLALPLVRFLLDRSAEARSSRPAALGFFLLWAGWCVLFFSRSSSKLPPYILPAMPALALLFGWCLDRMLFGAAAASLFRGARTAVPRCGGIVVAAGLVVGNIGAWKMHLIGPEPALVQGLLCLGCLAVLAVWGGRLSARAAWLWCGALGAFLVVLVSHELVPAWAGRRSPLTRFADIRQAGREGRTPVACYDGEWGSVPFYLDRTDGVLNRPGLPPAAMVPSLVLQQRWLLIVRHKADLAVFHQAVAPFMTLTGVRYADEIGIGVLEAAPWWKKMLDAAAPVPTGP